MRVSFNWLRDYVDIDLSPEELAERLTLQGLAVDEVIRLGAGINGVVVGKVLEVTPHPNADRLRVCLVDVGAAGNGVGKPVAENVRQIVCGAPNVAAGQTVPVALPGAVLPGGLRIEERPLRGVRSQGMICSAQELDLAEESAGIMVLPDDWPAGVDFQAAAGLDDAILVLDLTPNYAMHCQSMLGVAREVAALLDRPVRLPEFRLAEADEPASAAVSVEIQAPDLCSRYIARVIRGVRVGPSPEWLRKRLEAAGMRSVNNVVDVTNYVMLETGQPLHAFDYAKIRGRRIVVRRAGDGERLITLDGAERELAGEDLVIADEEGAVAVAGVMGGLDSEVGADTVDIMLESAHFDNLAVRRTARRLGLHSEASGRFEKGVDPNGCLFAADRAAALIRELAGGTVLAGAVDVYPAPALPRRISLRPDRVNALLGTRLDEAEMTAILRRLGLEVAAGQGCLAVTVPTRRPDIEGEADLAEEIARIYGYNRIPVTFPRSPVEPAPAGVERGLLEAAREVCLGAGLNEVLTFSFMSPEAWDRMSLPADDPLRRAVTVANPLSEDQRVMRTSLLPLLLDAVAANVRHRTTDVAIFEIGRVYRPKRLPMDELPEERLMLGIAMTGNLEPPTWRAPARPADFFVLKGLVEALLERLGVAGAAFVPGQPPSFHPGRAASLIVDGRAVGVVGEAHPSVQAAYDLPGRVYLAELDLTEIIAFASPWRPYRPLPRYPAADRDLAFALPIDIPAGRVAEVIRHSAGDLLSDLRLFDVYQGEQVEPGWRSLAYALTYQAPDRTLTDAEVESVHNRVRQALQNELGARLRS